MGQVRGSVFTVLCSESFFSCPTISGFYRCDIRPRYSTWPRRRSGADGVSRSCRTRRPGRRASSSSGGGRLSGTPRRSSGPPGTPPSSTAAPSSAPIAERPGPAGTRSLKESKNELVFSSSFEMQINRMLVEDFKIEY